MLVAGHSHRVAAAAPAVLLQDILEAAPVDKYFELYKPGGCWVGAGGRYSAGLLGGIACRLPLHLVLAGRALIGSCFLCWLLPASPGGGAAGGFIRVAISFLEPDQVRNGDVLGGGGGRKQKKG